MKILIFIDHDILVRHFLHSKVFRALEIEHDLIYVFPQKGHKRLTSTEGNFGVEGGQVRRVTINQKRLSLWQKLNVTEMIRLRFGKQYQAIRKHHTASMGWKGAMLYSFLGLPVIFRLFQLYIYIRIFFEPCKELINLLENEKPDLVVHPSVLAGLFINDLVKFLPKYKIPLLVIMNSWDNPSTKKALTGNPDWLLVWGPQTRNHAIKYMGMPADRVVDFGVAQFDVYRSRPSITREDFIRAHDILEGSNILLYAGSSKDTDEYYHLCLIDNAIEMGLLKGVTVIYRPHPWGGCGKEGSRVYGATWKNIRIESTMRGYVKDVGEGKILGVTTPSYQDTHNLLSYVDALVSPLSTIVLEGALHGKPSLCFLPDEVDANGHYKTVLPLTHFEDFFNSPEFMFVEGDDNLITGIKGLLGRVDNEEYSVDLRKACDHFIATFDSDYGSRLSNFITDKFAR